MTAAKGIEQTPESGNACVWEYQCIGVSVKHRKADEVPIREWKLIARIHKRILSLTGQGVRDRERESQT